MPDSSPAPGDGGDIIIKSGSCEIHFDSALFDKDPTDPRKRTHRENTVRIKRIVIRGNQEFDSGDLPGGFKGEIRITCE